MTDSRDEAKPSLSYADAGVDIERGDAFVDRLSTLIESTYGPAVIRLPDGFAGLYALGPGQPDDTVLVACADGVGTKLRIAFAMNRHDTVGIDLVAMNVNDCIVTGAKPLFFLDYIGTGTLDTEVGLKILEGVAKGCRAAGCALLGGETAEMPDMYPPGEYDLAGFCVGAVTRKNIIRGEHVQPGDVLVALPSSGLHSNGFSLVRRALFDRAGYSLDLLMPELGGRSLGEVVLEPTKIYVEAVHHLLHVHAATGAVRAMAHITGGGLPGNLPRVIPESVALDIDTHSWRRPPIFDVVQKAGNIADAEMWRVFNMGIGYVIITAADTVDAVIETLQSSGERPVVIGRVREATNQGDARAVHLLR